MIGIDREPVVAGTFYSEDANSLKQQLGDFFSVFEKQKARDNISAVIVPHAGYVYSGLVAASAYAKISKDAQYDNVFIIGSSHHVSFRGASVYNQGNYKTPLGLVKVNVELANQLIKSTKEIIFKSEAHLEEHTIEVQLPFLQFYLEKMPPVIPLLIGTQDVEVCRRIANSLSSYFNSKNLFVISSDFSHYPEGDSAKMNDSLTADAICRNNPEDLKKVLDENRHRGVANLFTSLCGWTSVLTLLYMTTGKPFVYSKVMYQNSGDVLNGSKKRVVGYQSIIIERKEKNDIGLTAVEKDSLIALCRKQIVGELGEKWIDKEELKVPDFMKKWNSAFVSVYVAGELRGCLGRFDSDLRLEVLLKDLAVSAAFGDRRFHPVVKDELDDLRIEISLLTPMRKVSSINEIVLGKHGVYVKKGLNTGTFLPQVVDKTNWTKEEFLGHLSRDKARIGWDGWKEAEIYVYEAIVFSGKGV